MFGIALLVLAGLAAAAEPAPAAEPDPAVEPDPAAVEPDPALAEEEADDHLEVVLIVGEQPGPGLWKVSSGENTLWILGEISPYPRRVKWSSKTFERLMNNSQELLLDFSGFWRADHTGTRKLARAELLPDGVKLKDVVSPELYERFETVARRYGAEGLDELRPFAATNRLVVSAMDSMNMKSFSARFTAEQLGRRRRLKITRFAVPELPFEQRLENWQDDANVVCLERLLRTIGDGGAGVRRLANAWSQGDITALRELVPRYSFSRDGFRAGECAAAMHGGRKQAADYKRRRTQLWLQQAKRALKNNQRTMAVVPMSELFASDGYLAALRAAGYQIEEPFE